jgi:hypothetical protein
MDREFHRKAYYGGTVRHWYKGLYDARVYKVDVTGLYPSVMLSNVFPVGIRYNTGDGTVLAATIPVDVKSTLATVTVNGNGRLPVRNPDNSLDYPKGEFTTHLCGDELDYAYKQGLITAWHKHTTFDTTDAFSRYVTYWYTIRQQAKATGDIAQDSLAKLMLNALYGKFAAKRAKWDTVKNMVPPKQWGEFLSFDGGTGKIVKLRAVAGVSQRETKSEEREDTFPAISAFITAAGRCVMNEARDICGVECVLAQQTDAFLLTQQGLDNLMQSDMFGPAGVKRVCRQR